jgi:hypothetical protein
MRAFAFKLEEENIPAPKAKNPLDAKQEWVP